MSDLTIYNQNVICHDEVLDQNVSQNVWSPNLFTTCPYGNPNHTFVSTYIIATVTDSNVMLVNKTLNTNGRYRDQEFKFTVPVGPSPSFVPLDPIVFDYNVRIVCYTLAVTADDIGDEFSIYITSPLPSGTITSNVSSGNQLIVSAGALNKLKVSYELILTDGVNTQNLGEITNINYNTSTVTVQNDVSFSFSSGSSLYSKIVLAKEISILNTSNITLGANVDNNMFLPAGTIIQLEYKNGSALSKTVNFRASIFT